MFYIMYLTNLCHRRRWPDPLFETRRTRNGWTCRVRVNHREYTSNHSYSTEEQARDKAAESAYMICRNFSMNDGMYPGQKQGQAGVTQGLPVAIGAGRKSRGSSMAYGSEYTTTSAYGSYGGTSSGGSSPRSSESELETGSRRSSSSSTNQAQQAEICYCRRAYVSSHQRCAYCLREAGYYAAA